jgi:hypothetical protein
MLNFDGNSYMRYGCHRQMRWRHREKFMYVNYVFLDDPSAIPLEMGCF